MGAFLVCDTPCDLSHEALCPEDNRRFCLKPFKGPEDVARLVRCLSYRQENLVQSSRGHIGKPGAGPGLVIPMWGHRVRKVFVLSVTQSSDNNEFQVKKGTVIVLHSDCMVLLQKK